METPAMDKNWKIETKAIQAGYEPKDGEPRVMPIVQSTTFKYDNAQCVADLFDLKREGFFYTRLANPTVDAFEKKVLWEKPAGESRIGIENLRFGDIVTDIVYEKGTCRVQTNAPYALEICGKEYKISAGANEFKL